MKDIADLLGRICLSIIFLFEAIDSILFYDSTIETMQSYGVTFWPNLWLSIAIFGLILGSVLIMIGYFARIGATLCLLYWLPFTFIVFSFWNDPPSTEQLTFLRFTTNMAVAGGLLLLLANGSGKYSVKRLIHRLRLPQ
ncbi:MAG TPA: DoxX family protein [Saprospirales bacterium]|jgi:putative oxidoreductase|nr:DoxX family protein [Saprospiraceae bacterium]HAV29552.1 DoxX family protein [Saprospirales bacterium]HAW05289.1 DoxX family protein [Saprospirales bacterium]